jgi:hypothetical protein
MSESIDHKIYAIQQDEHRVSSACSTAFITYRYDTTAPTRPTLVDKNSTNLNIVNFKASGLELGGPVGQVRLYSDSSCSSAVSNWSNITGAITNINSTALTENTAYTIYSRQKDATQTVIGNYNSPGHAREVVLSNDESKAYLSDDKGGLILINLADLTNPSLF